MSVLPNRTSPSHTQRKRQGVMQRQFGPVRLLSVRVPAQVPHSGSRSLAGRKRPKGLNCKALALDLKFTLPIQGLWLCSVRCGVRELCACSPMEAYCSRSARTRSKHGLNVEKARVKACPDEEPKLSDRPQPPDTNRNLWTRLPRLSPT